MTVVLAWAGLSCLMLALTFSFDRRICLYFGSWLFVGTDKFLTTVRSRERAAAF